MNRTTIADPFLEAVETGLREALDGRGPAEGVQQDLLQRAAQHLCFAGGKRARPRLTQLFGQAAGAPEEPLVAVAVAGELIHAASLLHDDVVDEGTIRRGRPTVNAVWGNTVAVLTGDLVLSLALAGLRPLPAVLMVEAVELIAAMTRASLLEVQTRGRLDLGFARWREVAVGKTGELFAWCGRGAAHLAGDAEARERFARCGRHLGVAFQLADDLKDLHEGSGKDRFSDIHSRTPSYPLLVAVEASARVREGLLGAWHEPQMHPAEVQELGEAVLQTKADAETLERLFAEVDAALEALGPYRRRPGGAELADWALGLSQGFLQPEGEAG
jgi:heptaprenyl diphosphate synthase